MDEETTKKEETKSLENTLKEIEKDKKMRELATLDIKQQRRLVNMRNGIAKKSCS